MFVIIELLIAAAVLTGVFLKWHKRAPKRAVRQSAAVVIILSAAVFFTLAQEEPKISGEVIEIEVNAANRIQAPKTTYMYLDVTDSVKISGDVDYGSLGEYEVLCEVPMIFKTYITRQIVKVVDTIGPEITVLGGEVVNLSYQDTYQELGVTATDNYDGDVTANIVVGEKKINESRMEIIYTVSDRAGNKSVKTRTVNFVDNVPPELTLNGNSRILTEKGKPYNEQGAKAIDSRDGDLTAKIQTEGTVNTEKAGTYTITYKVADLSGNEAVRTRTVVVTEEPVNATEGIDGENGVIYLTFDDGPSIDITPKILDLLKRRNVKATFFILNYEDAKEAIVKREAAEGHTVAIHGYSHDYKTIYKSEAAYMQNLTLLQDKIKKSTGQTAVITRFPGGSSNTVSRFNPGIMTRLTKEVVRSGYRYFDWNVTSGDAGGNLTVQQIYDNVTKSLSKSRMNVVLMHDFSGNYNTLNALDLIIDYGIENGYTFCAITENTPMITHKVNN